jgi:hypothetical protein
MEARVKGLIRESNVVPTVSVVESVTILIIDGDGKIFRLSCGEGQGLTKRVGRPSSIGIKA